MNQDKNVEFRAGEEFLRSRAEARNFALLWVIQTAAMISVFLLLGYNRIDDPLGFPFGFPGWFVVGVLGGAIIFGLVGIVMALRMKEVSVK